MEFVAEYNSLSLSKFSDVMTSCNSDIVYFFTLEKITFKG